MWRRHGVCESPGSHNCQLCEYPDHPCLGLIPGNPDLVLAGDAALKVPVYTHTAVSGGECVSLQCHILQLLALHVTKTA